MVREKVMDVLTKEYGIDAAALGHLWQTMPAVRSSQFQRSVYDAVAHRLARESIHRAPPNLPPVQRPGMDGDFGNRVYDHAAELSRAFKADPNPKNAAKVLAARRRAAADR
jgi:hypothetical protein